MVNLAEGFVFNLVRVSGSHHIFINRGFRKLVNLQSERSRAKLFKIRQLFRLVYRYNLALEEEE